MVLSGLVMGLAPVMALAQPVTTGTTGSCPGLSQQGVTNITDITTLLCKISGILNAIIPVLVTLGVVYFVWGVITYVISSDEEAKKTGRNRIIYGIIGLAVIIGMWGLVTLLRNTFLGEGANNRSIQYPTVPYNQ